VSLEFLAIQTLNGISYGLLLFMLASGLTLIFSMMGVLNFAHASFYMLGAYFGFQITKAIGFWPAVLIAPLAVGLIGALIERYALRKVHVYGHVAELLFTFGLAFIIEELVQMVWGRVPVDYRIPAELNSTAFTLFNSSYPTFRVFILLVAVTVFGLLLLLLTKTRLGLIVRAALTQPRMVGMLGHNVPLIFSSCSVSAVRSPDLPG